MSLAITILATCLAVMVRMFAHYDDGETGPIPRGKSFGRALTGLIENLRGATYSVVTLVALLSIGFIFNYAFGGLLACIYLIMVAGLLSAVLVDVQTYTLPDSLTLGLAVFGVAAATIVPAVHHAPQTIAGHIQSCAAAVSGVLIGSGTLLWMAMLLEKITHKEYWGFGDIKLLGAIGAFGGWDSAVFAIIGGSFLGTMCLPVIIYGGFTKKHGEITGMTNEPSDSDPNKLVTPFGPFLSIAGAAYILTLHEPIRTYFNVVVSAFQL